MIAFKLAQRFWNVSGGDFYGIVINTLNWIFIVGKDKGFDLVAKGLKMEIFYDTNHSGFERIIFIKTIKCPASRYFSDFDSLASYFRDV